MAESLDSLSEELLDRIISFITSPPHLSFVTRASKRFNRIALPYLYCKVSFLGAWSDTGTKHLRPFAFLMLQRPDLAALVKSFSHRNMLSTAHRDDPLETAVNWPQDPGLDEILKREVEKYAKDEDVSKKWLEVVRAGHNEAAILALLLPALINLQYLDVPFDFEFDGDGAGVESKYLMNMLDLAGRDGQFFNNLTDVMIPGTNEKYPDSPDWFATCIALPAIKRIYGHNQGNEDQGMEDDESVTRLFARLRPYSSTIEFIEMRQSKLSIKNFRFLLHAPKCLKTLIYEIGNTWAWTHIKFSAIESALTLQKGNLERLSLGYQPDFFPFFPGEEETPMSFSSLAALKELRVAPIYLYGQDILQLREGDGVRHGSPPSEEDLKSSKMMLVNAIPSQLETLSLIQCDDPSTVDRLVISLREVLARRDQFENLREVIIHSMKRAVLEERIILLITLPWKDKGVRLVLKVEAEINFKQKNYTDRSWGWDEDVEWNECLNDYRGDIEVLFNSESYQNQDT